MRGCFDQAAIIGMTTITAKSAIAQSARLDVDSSGRTHGGVWILGPLRRGSAWETTAVPEIRAQARRLALDIAATEALPVAA